MTEKTLPKTVIVTIPGMIGEADWAKLSKRSEVQYVERKIITEAELLETIKYADYLMLNFDVIKKLSPNFYLAIREKKLPLKAISADITGMSWASTDAANENDIILMETPDYSTVSVAEFSLASLLLIVKKMHLVFQDSQNRIEEKAHRNDVIADKTVGIVGLGNIGTYFAGLLQGFGCRVVGWNRTPKNVSGVKNASLEELFSQADYISLHLKTTNETKGMVNKKLLSSAKDGLIIVNQADGPIVDNDALFAAIKKGKVSAYSAGSEAVKGHALASESSVVTFPPQAWLTDHSLAKLRETWVGNILSAIDGNPVNITR